MNDPALDYMVIDRHPSVQFRSKYGSVCFKSWPREKTDICIRATYRSAEIRSTNAAGEDG